MAEERMQAELEALKLENAQLKAGAGAGSEAGGVPSFPKWSKMIGNTPLVDITSMASPKVPGVVILGKAEFLNPGKGGVVHAYLCVLWHGIASTGVLSTPPTHTHTHTHTPLAASLILPHVARALIFPHVARGSAAGAKRALNSENGVEE